MNFITEVRKQPVPRCSYMVWHGECATGVLSDEVFGEPALKAWNALMHDAVHPDGFLGYVQGTGKEPKDGQPVGYDSKPDFEDFAIGCYLLAGAEMIKFLTQ